jgi:hypothetical protein
MFMRVRTAWFWGISTVLLACHSEPNGFERGCDSLVSFEIGPGLTPQIGWSPQCKVGLLRVSGPSGIVWQVRAADQFGPDNLIEPTLRYGVQPAGTKVEMGPLPLVTGDQYAIQVWIVDLNSMVIGAGEGTFER